MNADEVRKIASERAAQLAEQRAEQDERARQARIAVAERMIDSARKLLPGAIMKAAAEGKYSINYILAGSPVSDEDTAAAYRLQKEYLRNGFKAEVRLDVNPNSEVEYDDLY